MIIIIVVAAKVVKAGRRPDADLEHLRDFVKRREETTANLVRVAWGKLE